MLRGTAWTQAKTTKKIVLKFECTKCKADDGQKLTNVPNGSFFALRFFRVMHASWIIFVCVYATAAQYRSQNSVKTAMWVDWTLLRHVETFVLFLVFLRAQELFASASFKCGEAKWMKPIKRTKHFELGTDSKKGWIPETRETEGQPRQAFPSSSATYWAFHPPTLSLLEHFPRSQFGVWIWLLGLGIFNRH